MFLQQIFDGLTLGIVYALIAVGYSLVFGVLRMINFAHGSMYAFGAHIAMMVAVSLNAGLVPALVSSTIATGMLCFLMNKLCIEPLRKRKSTGISALIVTIGCSYIIQNSLMIIFGSNSKWFPKIFDFGVFQVGPVTVKATQLGIVIASVLLLLLLSLLVNHTKAGLAMRAVQQNTKAAYLMGINVNRVIALTFFLGGASAAFAGTLISGYYQIVNPQMGALIGMKAFAAAVLGGIGILYGSVIGGLVVGMSESLAAYYLGGGYRDATAFIILILVLVFRPNGLFGRKAVEKV